MNNKKVVLISLDALASTEFSALSKMPNFGKIIKQGAYCKKERSVYPSLTFPSHASIATGCVPGKHGVVNNYIFSPFAPVKKWYAYAAALKKKALWDYAAENNKTVLSLSWPVSAGANIKYSLPEMTPAKPKIWNKRMFFEQVKVWFKNGTASVALKALSTHPGFSKAWFFGTQPTLDIQMIELLKKSLIHYSFDIAMFHIYGMDDAKHTYGANSPKAHKYLRLYDELAGFLLAYADDEAKKGIDTVIMITGDHSQLNISKNCYLNHALEELNLCKWKNGKLQWWKAIADSGDGMAYIYINEGENKREIVKSIMAKLIQNPAISKIMLPEEFRRLGCEPNAALAIEANIDYGFKDGYYTEGKLDENYVTESDDKAIHGYLPSLPDYQTSFYCYGNAVNAGAIEDMCITDIAPTICEWFGFETQDMDGKPVHNLLKP